MRIWQVIRNLLLYNVHKIDLDESEQILTKIFNININDDINIEDKGFNVSQNYPNPMEGKSTVGIFLPH